MEWINNLNFLISIDAIQKEELRSILLGLNLDLKEMILEDYCEVHFADGTDSSRSTESYNWDQFRGLFLLILKS